MPSASAACAISRSASSLSPYAVTLASFASVSASICLAWARKSVLWACSIWVSSLCSSSVMRSYFCLAVRLWSENLDASTRASALSALACRISSSKLWMCVRICLICCLVLLASSLASALASFEARCSSRCTSARASILMALEAFLVTRVLVAPLMRAISLTLSALASLVFSAASLSASWCLNRIMWWCAWCAECFSAFSSSSCSAARWRSFSTSSIECCASSL
mmetsp:Transcript_34340/g.67082  ORF Transcript_34340/g.67082 Transcript_34340/m.67082 type:complete len:224 (-) Transcript_34340:739-1410(-)